VLAGLKGHARIALTSTPPPAGQAGMRCAYGVTGMTCLPIAQMNPESSRAIAATTTVSRFPLLLSMRYRRQSLVCAFQAISRMDFGCRSIMLLFSNATRAG
jgi:hypothetical protein